MKRIVLSSSILTLLLTGLAVAQPAPTAAPVEVTTPAPVAARPAPQAPLAAAASASAEPRGILDRLFGWFRGKPAEPERMEIRQTFPQPQPTPALEDRGARGAIPCCAASILI